MAKPDIIPYALIFLATLAAGQNEDFETEISSNLTSYQIIDLAAPSNSRQDGGPLGVGLAGEPPVIPPQNVPVNPLGPVAGPLGPNGLPDGFVPFGLNHIILIVVPMFKAKIHKLPSWLSSNIKISMPITVFFDQLNVPPGMFTPGLVGGLPFLGIPPPIGLPPPPGIGPGPIPPPGKVVAPAPTTNSHTNPSFVFPPYSYDGDDNSYVDAESQQSDLADDGYEDSYYPEEGRKLRRKRAIYTIQSKYQPRKKLAFTFNETVHATERAALIPRLESLLEKSGFGGKPCLLRALCEVHEAPLDHYGLLGEMFTLFFSVSRSAFAESHLPEYLRAEALGKAGDCSEYYTHCKHTMFSEDEGKTSKTKKKPPKPFFVNVIDEVL